MSDALPPWVQALESACSPLVRACRPALAPTFPRGVEALKQIGASIEEFVFREHASEEEERTFVERTGALLALVLIDHVGDGAYVSRNGVSRARLKTRAFFDPFSVIDAALDAEKPQRFLAEVVGKLEAEANDEGPLSRVLWAMAIGRSGPCKHRYLPYFISWSVKNQRNEDVPIVAIFFSCLIPFLLSLFNLVYLFQTFLMIRFVSPLLVIISLSLLEKKNNSFMIFT